MMGGYEKEAVIIEGKTKVVYDIKDSPYALIESKDRITAGDGARSNMMQGKAVLSTKTNGAVFSLLKRSGVPVAWQPSDKVSETEFIATKCDMVPIEFVTRRIATGSFLKRHVHVKEGYKFHPLKSEYFFKDDANHDPQVSYEEILLMGIQCGKQVLNEKHLQIMSEMAVTVFEILERAWAQQDCSLVDMKVEFGLSQATGECLLADVIDNDSWRLWPAGDKKQQKDKQAYRELEAVNGTVADTEGLKMVKRNYDWVVERCELLEKSNSSRVVILLGSQSDLPFSANISAKLDQLGITNYTRICSAHKTTQTALAILAQYEDLPTVYIAVAGRSNGLGPVLAGNTVHPVINCPPVSPSWGAQDIWSSLRMPSGMGCSTVLGEGNAALAAASILSMSDHVVWGALKGAQLNNSIKLKNEDYKNCNN